jgi:hypothetical protein
MGGGERQPAIGSRPCGNGASNADPAALSLPPSHAPTNARTTHHTSRPPSDGCTTCESGSAARPFHPAEPSSEGTCRGSKLRDCRRSEVRSSFSPTLHPLRSGSPKAAKNLRRECIRSGWSARRARTARGPGTSSGRASMCPEPAATAPFADGRADDDAMSRRSGRAEPAVRARFAAGCDQCGSRRNPRRCSPRTPIPTIWPGSLIA